MIALYSIIISLLFYSALPLLLLIIVISGRHKEGLKQRFGFYPMIKGGGRTDYWIHASSVGEVNAVQILLAEILEREKSARIVVTTMTVRGREVAEKLYEGKATCYLAPLDVPFIVSRAISTVKPKKYICLETELWPVIIYSLRKKRVPVFLVNGRISDRSYASYLRVKKLVSLTLHSFRKIAVISKTDRNRFISLGAEPGTTQHFGNIKYDLLTPLSSREVQKKYQPILQVVNEKVFVAGSTHDDEEEQVVDLYLQFLKPNNYICLIAPRHIERIDELKRMLQKKSIDFHLLSELLKKDSRRLYQFILMDTMGDLAEIYGVADYIFCGGSLVNKGGHNLIEGAIWQKPIFFGPYIEDFRDAAELLEENGGGKKVSCVEDLKAELVTLSGDNEQYRRRCEGSAAAYNAIRGASKRQLAFIFNEE